MKSLASLVLERFLNTGSSSLRSHHQIFFSGSSSGHGAFWIRMRWCRCFWSPSSLTKQWSSSFGFNTWVFCRFWASWPFLKFTCKPLVGNYGTSHTRTFNCDKNLEIAFEIKIEILRVYLAQISRLERAQPTKRKLESSPENLGQKISFLLATNTGMNYNIKEIPLFALTFCLEQKVSKLRTFSKNNYFHKA